jgi:hypothetical protein
VIGLANFRDAGKLGLLRLMLMPLLERKKF